MLATFGNGGPKLAVENFAVGLDHDSRVGHLVFVRAENLAEIFDLRVHAVEHLPHGVDFDFTAFKTFECKANRKMLGQFHQDGFIRLAFGRLRCKPGNRALQSVLRGARQLIHLLLELSSRSGATLACADVAEAGQRAQNSIDLIFARSGALAGSVPRSAAGAVTPAATCASRSGAQKSTCDALNLAGDSCAAAPLAYGPPARPPSTDTRSSNTEPQFPSLHPILRPCRCMPHTGTF